MFAKVSFFLDRALVNRMRENNSYVRELKGSSGFWESMLIAPELLRIGYTESPYAGTHDFGDLKDNSSADFKTFCSRVQIASRIEAILRLDGPFILTVKIFAGNDAVVTSKDRSMLQLTFTIHTTNGHVALQGLRFF